MSSGSAAATADIAQDQNVVHEGDTIIIRMYDDKSTMMLTVSRKERQKIGRKRFFNVSCLIGVPYGSIFEVNGSNLDRVIEDEDEEDELDAWTGDDENAGTADSPVSGAAPVQDAEVGTIGGNKNFFDTNTAQKMSQSDIEAMRKAGTSGVDIIKSLIANSDTFSSKTSFSQAKWIKRKKQKYCQRFRVIKACPKSLCEVYHHKSAAKIANLRWDSLAQILSHGGVYAGARVLIFDATLGLVLGSVAYRMRGFGHITAIYPGQQPHFDIVPRFNLDAASVGIIEPAASSEIYAAGEYIRVNGFMSKESTEEVVAAAAAAFAAEKEAARERKIAYELANATAAAAAAATSSSTETPAAEEEDGKTAPAAAGKRPRFEKKDTTQSKKPKGGEGDEDIGDNLNNVHENKPGSVVPYTSSNRNPVLLTRVRGSLRQGYTSFILCTSRHHHLAILQHALPLLLPSSPFALHCDAMEPLVECYQYLHSKDLALKMVLTDTWMREFQTLPGRMHPLMNIPASGGYLLTGIYTGSMSLLAMTAATVSSSAAGSSATATATATATAAEATSTSATSSV